MKTVQELIDSRPAFSATNLFAWAPEAAAMLRTLAQEIESLRKEIEVRKAYGDEQTAFAIKNANERDAYKADAERLNWIEATHKDNILHLGSTWYSRNGYGSQHKKHKSLRDACDYAMKGQS